MVKAYIVGGYVRDQIMNLPSKDVDYSVEGVASFDEMREWIVAQGGTIFVETPEHLTIRANIGGKTYDYVMCRRDGGYSDGRRPDVVYPGTLLDDLSRRDFTMNALAIDPDTGDVIDYFGGIADIENKIIRCVGYPSVRFNEDALRILRAARFSITKGMRVDPTIETYFDDFYAIQRMIDVISSERIEGEIDRMFRFDTPATIKFFAQYPKMTAIFGDRIWLMPTSRKR